MCVWDEFIKKKNSYGYTRAFDKVPWTNEQLHKRLMPLEPGTCTFVIQFLQNKTYLFMLKYDFLQNRLFTNWASYDSPITDEVTRVLTYAFLKIKKNAKRF